jgi:hypothetical protein
VLWLSATGADKNALASFDESYGINGALLFLHLMIGPMGFWRHVSPAFRVIV